MLQDMLDMAEGALAATSAAAAGEAFHRATVRHGVTYLQLRRYRRPRGRLTSRSHWQAGGVVSRYCPPGWEGSSGFRYICFENNPILAAVADGVTRFRFRDYAPDADPRFGPYWDALGVHAFGHDGAVASVHVGFPGRDAGADLTDTVQAAASLVAEHLLRFDPAQPRPSPLTARERDAMAFVAEGKTDWEIGAILGVSEATARFHVDNARRKLGATNRAHAVARFLAASFL